jgi:hypothetical protein
MPHARSQRLAGKFVIANFKPVLWYVKEFRRGRSLAPDFLKSPPATRQGRAPMGGRETVVNASSSWH